jgi:rod shape-determining protein MreC
MLQSGFNAKRFLLVGVALCIALLLFLPKQSRLVLEHVGGPVAHIVVWPLNALSWADRGVRDIWEGYLALQGVYDDNRRLRTEIATLRHLNEELREAAVGQQRLASLLAFKQRLDVETIAAQVIGRDASGRYRAVLINKGESDGVRAEMGVITAEGVVGRVVKARGSSAVVLLVTDPNNAVTGLVQRTRDEGIVQGSLKGMARMKYLPLLSTMEEGDVVVTSGLTGEFPRGVTIGTIAAVQKAEGDVFQSAEIRPSVDFTKLEEVLIVSRPVMKDEVTLDPRSDVPERKDPKP